MNQSSLRRMSIKVAWAHGAVSNRGPSERAFLIFGNFQNFNISNYLRTTSERLKKIQVLFKKWKKSHFYYLFIYLLSLRMRRSIFTKFIANISLNLSFSHIYDDSIGIHVKKYSI